MKVGESNGAKDVCVSRSATSHWKGTARWGFLQFGDRSAGPKRASEARQGCGAVVGARKCTSTDTGQTGKMTDICRFIVYRYLDCIHTLRRAHEASTSAMEGACKLMFILIYGRSMGTCILGTFSRTGTCTSTESTERVHGSHVAQPRRRAKIWHVFPAARVKLEQKEGGEVVVLIKLELSTSVAVNSYLHVLV